jgi:polyisoprenoid-binding protein YceI
MKIKLFCIAIALLLSFKSQGQTNWKLDAAHSNLNFSIPHLSVSEITGTVKIMEALIIAPKEDLSDAAITMKADMNSIDTDNDKRDTHLKSADFFDAEKFPEIKFESTSFKKSGEGNYTVTGNLTMHGITKPVTMNASVKTGINPNNNKPITGMKVTCSIKRTDFDISKDAPEAVLGNDVSIVANMEFSKQEAGK